MKLRNFSVPLLHFGTEKKTYVFFNIDKDTINNIDCIDNVFLGQVGLG